MASRRDRLRKIAEETLAVVKKGSYTVPSDGTNCDLRASINSLTSGTLYYSAHSEIITHWTSCPAEYSASSATEVAILEVSTIEGAQFLSNNIASQDLTDKIGILNFASAKKPGGGFLGGAQAQEESLARSSTLYPSLMTDAGQSFYTTHKRDPKAGFYSHAMIYSPGVVFFRNDDGGWTAPMEADVLVSPAVNAGRARSTKDGRRPGHDVEERIEAAMRERMGRILFLFRHQGIKNIVLGSFGTGVFRNNVPMVARLWAELLTKDEAPFKSSFDRVVFAILGTDTFNTFKRTFESNL